MSQLEHTVLFGADGRASGEIEHVLFHPTEPRVVGFQVRPNPFYYVVRRRPVFVPLANVHFAEEGLPQARTKKPQAKGQGFEWESTVIWRSMPVRDEAGQSLGVVNDAGFTKKSGRVTWLEVSGGAVSDAAMGRRRFPGEAAAGFDGEAIVVTGVEDVETSGGLAKAAGTGAAVVTVQGERLVRKAGEAGTAAAIRVGRSFKDGAARKAIDRMKDAGQRWLGDEDEDE